MTTQARTAIALVLWMAVVAQAAPDEDLLGRAQKYPVGPRERQAEHLIAADRPEHLVASYSGALETLFPHRVVRKSVQAAPLRTAAQPARFTYSTADGKTHTSDDYLERQRISGLLVLKGGEIVLERYQYDRTATTRFLSASMAKSVTALLIGIAIDEGKIASINDQALKYVPALAGQPYGEATIKQLLQMSSGVKFSEDYDGTDDISELIRSTVEQKGAGGAAAVRPYQIRINEAGKKFYYASAESQVLGMVIRGATGVPVADYLATRIWQPMGAESDASYIIDAAGQEATYAFLHATLRDFARLGMLLANNGYANGKQIVPAAWLREATQAVEPHVAPSVATPYFGYGYQFWVFPTSKRRFALIGARGQMIAVDPELNLVMVHTAVWGKARDIPARAEMNALWRGIVGSYGSW